MAISGSFISPVSATNYSKNLSYDSNNMNEKQITAAIDNIQDTLESMHGENIDIIFLSSNHNRGVINGTPEGLAALIIYNIAKYPVMKDIVLKAVDYYLDHKEEIDTKLKDDKPSHEIVDIQEVKEV